MTINYSYCYYMSSPKPFSILDTFLAGAIFNVCVSTLTQVMSIPSYFPPSTLK